MKQHPEYYNSEEDKRLRAGAIVISVVVLIITMLIELL